MFVHFVGFGSGMQRLLWLILDSDERVMDALGSIIMFTSLVLSFAVPASSLIIFPIICQRSAIR